MTDFNREFAEAIDNDQIGTELVHETDTMRIWHIFLAPGERLQAHFHDRPYFWTALSDGLARATYADGHVSESQCCRGDTRQFDLTPETGFVHALENIGQTDLIFVTVEFKNPNQSWQRAHSTGFGQP